MACAMACASTAAVGPLSGLHQQPTAVAMSASRCNSSGSERMHSFHGRRGCTLAGFAKKFESSPRVLRQQLSSNLLQPASAGLCVRNQGPTSAVSVRCSGQSLSEKFKELKSRNEVALIPFIVAGDPDLATTEKALLALSENGADIIELGVPYSDPLADGPVIQAAAARALERGTDLQSVLDVLAKVSPNLTSPVVLFTYFNPIMKRGMHKFMQAAKQAGAAGLVVPDVPLEETGLIRDVATANGLELVLLTTPTTPDARMEAIADATQGFLYLVSLTGVTGERRSVEGRVEGLLHSIKRATDKPVAVGFGISQPEHVEQVVSWGADGVIVGSALVRLLGDGASTEEGLTAVTQLMRTLKSACQVTASTNRQEEQLQSAA